MENEYSHHFILPSLYYVKCHKFRSFVSNCHEFNKFKSFQINASDELYSKKCFDSSNLNSTYKKKYYSNQNGKREGNIRGRYLFCREYFDIYAIIFFFKTTFTLLKQ